MAETQRPAWMDAAPEAAQAYDEIVNDPRWGAIPEKKKAALMRKFARVVLAPELPGRGKDPAMSDFFASAGVAKQGKVDASWGSLAGAAKAGLKQGAASTVTGKVLNYRPEDELTGSAHPLAPLIQMGAAMLPAMAEGGAIGKGINAAVKGVETAGQAGLAALKAGNVLGKPLLTQAPTTAPGLKAALDRAIVKTAQGAIGTAPSGAATGAVSTSAGTAAQVAHGHPVDPVEAAKEAGIEILGGAIGGGVHGRRAKPAKSAPAAAPPNPAKKPAALPPSPAEAEMIAQGMTPRERYAEFQSRAAGERRSDFGAMTPPAKSPPHRPRVERVPGAPLALPETVPIPMREVGAPPPAPPRPDALTAQVPRPPGTSDVPLVPRALREMQAGRSAAPPRQLPAPPIAGYLPEQVAFAQPPVGGFPGAPPPRARIPGLDALTAPIPRREFNSTVPKDLLYRAPGGAMNIPEVQATYTRGNGKSNAPVVEAFNDLQRRRPDRHWATDDAPGGGGRVLDLGHREIYADPLEQAHADWSYLEDLANFQKRTQGAVSRPVALAMQAAQNRTKLLGRQAGGEPRPTDGEAAPETTAAQAPVPEPAGRIEPPPGVRAYLSKPRPKPKETERFEKWLETPQGQAWSAQESLASRVTAGPTGGGFDRAMTTEGGELPGAQHSGIQQQVQQGASGPLFAIGSKGGSDLAPFPEEAIEAIAKKHSLGLRVVPAPIRIEQKWLNHLEVGDKSTKGHLKEIQALGYRNGLHFVEDVANTFTEIREGRGRSLMLVKPIGRGHLIYVELVQPRNGAYFSAKTGFEPNQQVADYVQQHKLLWSRAPQGVSLDDSPGLAAQLPSDFTSRAASGQSSDPHVPEIPVTNITRLPGSSDSSGPPGPANNPQPNFLSQGAAESRAWIRQNYGPDHTRLGSGMDTELLFHMARIGAEHMAQGTRRFYDWAKSMFAEFGPPIVDALAPAWNAARRLEGLVDTAFVGAAERTGLTRMTSDLADRWEHAKRESKTGHPITDAVLDQLREWWLNRYNLDPAYTALKDRGANVERDTRARGEALRNQMQQRFGQNAPEQAEIYETLTDRGLTDTRHAEFTEPTRAEIDEISNTLERVGVLASAGHSEYAGQYLKRLYSKYMTDDATALDKLFKRFSNLAIKGSKHRGLTKTLTKEQFALYNRPWRVVEERSDAKVLISDGETQALIPRRRVGDYVSERKEKGSTAPREDHWSNLGSAPGGKVKAWRDWSREEQDKMGVHRHAGDALYATFQGFARDLRNGLHLEAISQNRDWSLSAAEAASSPDFGTIEVRPVALGSRNMERVLVRPDGQVWKFVGSEAKNNQGLPRWGKLADHFVNPAIHRDLMQADRIQTEMPALRAITKMWARFKTVWNQASWLNNFMGGLITAEMAGGSFFDLPEAVGLVKNKGELFERLQRAGLYNDAYARTELLKDSPPGNGSFAGAVAQVLGASLNTMRDVNRTLAEGYGAIDDITRTTLAISKMKQGMTPEQAAAYARENMPNFDFDAPAMHNPVLKLFYPFAAYPYWAIGRLPAIIGKNPGKLAKLVAYWLVWNQTVNAINREQYGETEEQQRGRAELLPDYLKGPHPALPWGVPVPFRDTKGQTLVVSTRNWNPLGPVAPMDRGGLAPIRIPGTPIDVGIPEFLTPGGPLVPLYNSFVANHDPFLQREIVDTAQPQLEQLKQLGGYLADQELPTSWIHNLGKLRAGVLGEPDIANRRYDVPTALVNQAGLKLQPIEETVLFQRMISRHEAKMRDIQAPVSAALRRAQEAQGTPAYESRLAEYHRIREQQERLAQAELEHIGRRAEIAEPAIR
jgi:hypothetical protein